MGARLTTPLTYTTVRTYYRYIRSSFPRHYPTHFLSLSLPREREVSARDFSISSVVGQGDWSVPSPLIHKDPPLLRSLSLDSGGRRPSFVPSPFNQAEGRPSDEAEGRRKEQIPISHTLS